MAGTGHPLPICCSSVAASTAEQESGQWCSAACWLSGGPLPVCCSKVVLPGFEAWGLFALLAAAPAPAGSLPALTSSWTFQSPAQQWRQAHMSRSECRRACLPACSELRHRCSLPVLARCPVGALRCQCAAAAWRHPRQERAAESQSTQVKGLVAGHEPAVLLETEADHWGCFEPIIGITEGKTSW